MADAHPLDNPKVGDRWIFSIRRPDGSTFKRDFLIIEWEEADGFVVVMDYALWGPLAEFPFETGIWRDGSWKKVRSGK